jgi:hypothetical protein
VVGERGVTGETMHDAPGNPTVILTENGGQVSLGIGASSRIPVVDDNGQAQFDGQVKLGSESFVLNVFGCVFVVVVEADLTKGGHTGLTCQMSQFVQGVRGNLVGVVRMNADRGEETGPAQSDGVPAGVDGVAHNDEPVQRREGGIQHAAAVGVKHRILKVAMRINQTHQGNRA